MDADFWWLLTVASLVWYSTIVYVSVRGVADIKHMLKRLQSLRDQRDQDGR